MTSLSQAVTAFSPLIVALLAGFFAARERSQSSSQRYLARLTAEAEALQSLESLQSLPKEAGANDILAAQIVSTARKYAATCALEDSLSRDKVGIGLGVVLGGGGIILGTWAALQGGAHFWWWILAIPAIVLGVPGFFHELGGGDSRKTQTGGHDQGDQA
ncbi:hypothetical protein [Streptomyces sp. NPDC048172]|uniref:hypothetical protein n=1 Tax=Streptomyces sp. NPDC048172 TaxID=3365505 RepID=UPI003716201F